MDKKKCAFLCEICWILHPVIVEALRFMICSSALNFNISFLANITKCLAKNLKSSTNLKCIFSQTKKCNNHTRNKTFYLQSYSTLTSYIEKKENFICFFLYYENKMFSSYVELFIYYFIVKIEVTFFIFYFF